MEQGGCRNEKGNTPVALASRLAVRVRAVARVAAILFLACGAAIVLAIVSGRDPRAASRLDGVGNRLQTAARLPRLDATKPIVFLVVGGEECGLAQALERGLEAEPQAAFAVLAGDLAREATPEGYSALLDEVGRIAPRPPVFCLRGEREAASDGAAFRAMFGDRVFDFEVGGCLFLMLDNGAGAVPQPQLARYERILDLHREPPRRIFAFVHRAGGPGGEATLAEFSRRRKVDCVIAGHGAEDERERSAGTEWLTIGAHGAEAIAFEIDAEGRVSERVVAREVGAGPLARAAFAWRGRAEPLAAEHPRWAFAIATGSVLLGAALFVAARRVG